MIINLQTISIAEIEKYLALANWPKEDGALQLKGSNINKEKIQALLAALNKNPLITILNASYDRALKEHLPAISTFIATHATLTTLRLFVSDFGDNDIFTFAGALKQNNSLVSLKLSHQIDDIGAEHIAVALETNTTLKELDLSYNDIGNKGIKRLCEGLANNTTLTHLNLSRNKVGDLGLTYLATLLTHNRTLVNLNLDFNEINTPGILGLVLALNQNKSLTHLNLKHNPFVKANKNNIAELLQKNGTLINLDCYSVFDFRYKMLKGYLERNRLIQEKHTALYAQISVMTAFIRANKLSELKYSVLPIIKHNIVPLMGFKIEKKSADEKSNLRAHSVFASPTQQRKGSRINLGLAMNKISKT